MAGQGTRSISAPLGTALLTEERPRPRITGLKRDTEASLGRLLKKLGQPGLPEVAALRPRAEELLARFGVAGELAARPRAARDMAVLAPFSTSLASTGEALNNVSGVVSTRLRLMDPVLAELVDIRQLAWAARSNYGLQCAVLRPAVRTSRPLSRAGAAELGRLRTGQQAEHAATAAGTAMESANTVAAASEELGALTSAAGRSPAACSSPPAARRRG